RDAAFTAADRGKHRAGYDAHRQAAAAAAGAEGPVWWTRWRDAAFTAADRGKHRAGYDAHRQAAAAAAGAEG
ncbi:hypothetical protein CK247_31035, partial [Klebsiella pneumoniae]